MRLDKKKPTKFTRVSLSNELRADADGMPIFRKCFEHEILMLFYDDDGAYAFKEWWDDSGAKNFYNWLSKHNKWKHVADKEVKQIEKETKKAAIEKFGFDPNTVGYRNRGWWIVSKIDEEEEVVGAEIGDLCVKTRDGGDNPRDPDASQIGNYIGSIEDYWDTTYRYYYYRPLNKKNKNES